MFYCHDDTQGYGYLSPTKLADEACGQSRRTKPVDKASGQSQRTKPADKVGGQSRRITPADIIGRKTFGKSRQTNPSAEDRDLVHSFVEGPQADLIYRGKVTLVDGTATVNLDERYGLIDGTWEALCRDPQVWVTSDDGWTLCKGSVSGATLTITAQDPTCAETVSWLVVAERQDDNIKGANWTDEDGRPILEPTRAS